jgi:polyisoprenyl-phosphate glycosyltransferase
MTWTIAIVTPVLDDWVSFNLLVDEISNLFSGSEFAFHICAVDDGSSTPFDADAVALPESSCILSIEVIRLAANLGHQRAIAVGLCAIAESTEIDAVLVIDSDGQDRPIDIALLLASSCRRTLDMSCSPNAPDAPNHTCLGSGMRFTGCSSMP